MSTPSEIYKNAIDLNRFSNRVSRRVASAYIDAALAALERIGTLSAVENAAQVDRLNAIVNDLKGSLDRWAESATSLSVDELQGLVDVERNFAIRILDGELPSDVDLQVRNVEISPQFAQAVATIDPTVTGVVRLSDDLGATVLGIPKTFKLDVGDGTSITLPNGATLQQSYERLAQKQVEIFSREVRNGLLIGDSTDKIIRVLREPMERIPQAQIKTLVRTSVNQIANAAEQAVYGENSEISKKYKYRATLDSRTSAICRALDGREFKYDQGPVPPQHFNCRSTTEPVIDYKGLGIPPPSTANRRSSSGVVPADQDYGEWLYNQSAKEKATVLGPKKVKYFDYLARKYGADIAIRKFVREDGQEVTLKQLAARYPKVK